MTAALEKVLIAIKEKSPVQELLLRSDNGLIFRSKSFAKVGKCHGFDQEYTAPYNPEHTRMIERFFRATKKECVW